VVFDLIKNGLAPALFARLPWSVLGTLVKVSPLIPYYHIVSDSDVPHVKHLYRFRNVDQFKKDIDTFLRSYNLLTLDDLLEALRRGRSFPRRAFLLTFDDGFRELYDVVAPVLLQKGLSATFFITTACLDNIDMAYHNKISLVLEHLSRMKKKAPEDELLRILSERGIQSPDVRTALLRIDYRNKDVLQTVANLLELDFDCYLTTRKPYLTSEQVRKLIDMGFSIGAHSIDHPLYSAISFEEQLHQTRASVRALRTRFSLNYGAFAFPHGAGDVSARFFSEIFAEGDVDVSFGTAGMLKDVFPRHFERFSMEYTSAPAERIIGRHYARGLFKRVIGRQVTQRT